MDNVHLGPSSCTMWRGQKHDLESEIMPLGSAMTLGLGLIAAAEEASAHSGLQTLLTVVGFIVVFAVGIVCEPLRHCIFRPKLALQYDEKNGSKLITIGTTRGGQDTELCFLRIRVTNKSITRRIARDCVAYLVEVKPPRDDMGPAPRFVDSLPMAWSYRTKGIPSGAVKMGVEEPPPPEERIDIPRGLSPFFDILHTVRGRNQFYWSFACGEPKRYRPLTSQQGEFTLAFMVSAENTAPATIKLKFTWRGDWDNFGIEQI